IGTVDDAQPSCFSRCAALDHVGDSLKRQRGCMIASLAMTSRSTAPVRARRHVLCGLWVAGLAGALPHSAGAEADARARADALFADGNAAIARDDAATAATRYRAAWELVPDARYALNLGIALSELGRTAAAAEAFTVYLADPACDPAQRPGAH